MLALIGLLPARPLERRLEGPEPAAPSRRRSGGRRFSRAAVVLLLLLLAGQAAAQSSMGFKHNVVLEATSAPALHWVSLPYLYTPQDVGTPGTLDAEDLCQDLDGIAAVLKWDESTSTFVQHLCGDPSPFALEQGLGFGIRLEPVRHFSAALSGGHDDGFAYSIPPSGGSQLTWLSVPLHVRIPEKLGDSRVTAEDLCQQIGETEVLAIVRWNPNAAAYESYGCGSAFHEPFQLVRGQAYGVVNRSSQTIDWQPIHY